MVAGSTGSGKTTLLSALLNDLEPGERYLVIEDTAEIRLEQPHTLRFTARKAAPGRPAVTIRDLVKASLRHRPDRLVVGEVRGGEAWDLIQALNTGHGGSHQHDPREHGRGRADAAGDLRADAGGIGGRCRGWRWPRSSARSRTW